MLKSRFKEEKVTKWVRIAHERGLVVPRHYQPPFEGSLGVLVLKISRESGQETQRDNDSTPEHRKGDSESVEVAFGDT